METPKNLLNEDNYQRIKKKILRLSVAVFVAGLILGGILIIIGAVKVASAQNPFDAIDDLTSESTKPVDTATEKLKDEKRALEAKLETEKEKLLTTTKTELEAKVTAVEAEIAATASPAEQSRLRQSITKENEALALIEAVEIGGIQAQGACFMKSNSYSTAYCAVFNQIADKEQAIRESEADFRTNSLENSDAGNKIFSNFSKTASGITGRAAGWIMIYFGVIIILISGGTAFGIYMFAMKREIAAFKAQQILPVAKESVETIAPAVGSVAREISKGIKDGIKDDKPAQKSDK